MMYDLWYGGIYGIYGMVVTRFGVGIRVVFKPENASLPEKQQGKCSRPLSTGSELSLQLELENGLPMEQGNLQQDGNVIGKCGNEQQWRGEVGVRVRDGLSA